MIKTRGIVLRQTNVKDYDRALTVLTAEHGRISVWAKGVRSRRNKMSGVTQPLCYSEMVLTKRGDMYTLNQGSIIETFYPIREDIILLSYAAYFMEVAGFIATEAQTARSLLTLLLNTLHGLKNPNGNPPALRLIFELRAMNTAGFRPVLNACAKCGMGEGAVYFDFRAGGTVCPACRTPGAPPIADSVIKGLDYILSVGLKQILAADIRNDIVQDLEYFAERFITIQLGHNFKSLDYLNQIIEKK